MHLPISKTVRVLTFTTFLLPSIGYTTPYEYSLIPPQHTWSSAPEQAPAAQGTIEVDADGTQLFYWDTEGTGAAVVFLHPFSGSALSWPYQQPVFADAGYRVIAYSRRGHYGSSSASPTYTQSGVQDLLAVVDHLDVDRFHLVAVAAGADIAPDFAVSHPDRLLSLTIGCTIGKPGDPAYRASDEALLPPEFLALPSYLKELGPSYRASYPQGAAAWREQAAISMSQRMTVPEQNVITPDVLRRIGLPTLLFTGDADLYMPPSRLRAYASYWSNPQVVLFQEAGHAPYWEQPIAFNRVLLEFLQATE